MSIAILDSYLTDLLSIVSSCFINILVEGEVTMAKGDIYDASKYSWQVRENTSGGVFIRYDNDISANNKGRYNTSEIVVAESNDGVLKFTTKSGSIYYFSIDKCAFPMHLLALQMRFGIEI